MVIFKLGWTQFAQSSCRSGLDLVTTGLEVLENDGFWASCSQTLFLLLYRVSLTAKLSMGAKMGTGYTRLTHTWLDRVGSRDCLVVWSIQWGEHPSTASRCYLQCDSIQKYRWGTMQAMLLWSGWASPIVCERSPLIASSCVVATIM